MTVCPDIDWRIAMIEHLKQTRGPAFGFAVHGVLTGADTTELIAKLDQMIGDYKKPIGLLAVMLVAVVVWPNGGASIAARLTTEIEAVVLVNVAP